MNDAAVCVDASLVLRLFLGPDDAQAWERWDHWTAEGRSIHAPALLGYEVANALHRYHRAGFLSAASRDVVLDAILALPVRLETGAGLHQRALALASDLALPAAYDAHYLALARSLDAELWTADARLARQVGDRPPRVMVLRSESSPAFARARAIDAVAGLQMGSVAQGNDQTTMDEIDEEIKAARRARPT